MVGEVVGAMVEIDCASVSMGERMPERRPLACDGGAASRGTDRVCSIVRDGSGGLKDVGITLRISEIPLETKREIEG
jgi:hypothetical protein